MKSLFKSFILLVVAFLAVTGILYFVKVIQAPPAQKIRENQYNEHLNSVLPDMRTNSEDLENSFQTLHDLIDRFNIEKAIDDDNYDKQLSALIEIYVPKFIRESYRIFDKSVWPDSTINFIYDRVTFLNGLKQKTNKDKAFIENFPEEQKMIEDIRSIISRYRSAQNLARKTSFISWSDAQKKIHDANVYKSMPYLSNNTALVTALNALPSKICDSQYLQLAEMVNNLSDFTSFHNVDIYRERMRDVVKEIQEYREKAYSVYKVNVMSRFDELNSNCREYSMNAEKYFAKQE